MIRLGDKYQAEEVLRNGVLRLFRVLPDNVDKWNERYAQGENPPSAPEAIAFTNAARLIKNKILHIRALYLCAQLDRTTLLAGYADADETKEFLCMQDIISSLAARPSLQKATSLDVRFGKYISFGLCCTLQLHTIPVGELRTYEIPGGLDSCDPLSDEGEIFVVTQCTEQSFCGKCTSAYRRQCKARRQGILYDLEKYIIIEPGL